MSEQDYNSKAILEAVARLSSYVKAHHKRGARSNLDIFVAAAGMERRQLGKDVEARKITPQDAEAKAMQTLAGGMVRILAMCNSIAYALHKEELEQPIIDDMLLINNWAQKLRYTPNALDRETDTFTIDTKIRTLGSRLQKLEFGPDSITHMGVARKNGLGNTHGGHAFDAMFAKELRNMPDDPPAGTLPTKMPKTHAPKETFAEKARIQKSFGWDDPDPSASR